MKQRLLCTVFLMMTLTACAVNGPGNDCSWAKPIWLEPSDQLSRPTLERILIHNQTWEKVCH